MRQLNCNKNSHIGHFKTVVGFFQAYYFTLKLTVNSNVSPLSKVKITVTL